jgi:general secretion pathway protein H
MAKRAAKATTPTSAPALSSSDNRPIPQDRGMRSKGFTLVEILVVVVIMAIVISLAVLSIGVTGRDSQLDEESRRIEGLLGLLHERALLEGRDFGLRIEPSAYEFVVYEAARDRWLRMDQDHEFRHRELPKGVDFELQLDSQTVVLKPVDRNMKSDQVSPNPQVAIAASGEGTPFRLTLERAATNAKASVEGDALGKISRVGSDHVDKRT